MQIDPKGGDIVYAALIQQKEKIDSDNPFVMLENTRRLYIAQSGLVGKNGTDTSAGKPLFRAEANRYTLKEGSDELIIDLHYQQSPQVEITKRFTLRRGDYLVGCRVFGE